VKGGNREVCGRKAKGRKKLRLMADGTDAFSV
jgi:hypothetical protein